MSESAFRPLTDTEQIFHDIVFRPMVITGEQMLEGWLPLLQVPVLKQLTETEVEVIAEWAYKQLCLFLDVSAIVFENNLLQAEYDRQSLRLKLVLLNKGRDSDDYKKAREDAKVALSKLTHINS